MATNQHFEQHESKNRALSLEAGLRRLTQLYKHSPIAFVSFDEDARIVDVNPAAARLLQITPAAVLGLSFSVLVADKISARFIEHLRRVRKSFDAPVKTELPLLTGSGGRLSAEIISCPVPMDTGRIYETAIIDLTDRQAAADAIRVSNEYAQSIVATIPFPVLVLDAHFSSTSPCRACMASKSSAASAPPQTRTLSSAPCIRTNRTSPKPSAPAPPVTSSKTARPKN